ncbi:MAG: preprotein translocase subunit SecE [Candidatus Sumerlaeia bacterium]|nr:preprotein translocase subunit SecE [Candidatus Sumerlaeia bacterium]
MSEPKTSRVRRFMKEVGVEMQKVSWPTKQELTGSTVVVLVITLLLTLYVGVIDYGCKQLVNLLVSLGAGGAG